MWHPVCVAEPSTRYTPVEEQHTYWDLTGRESTPGAEDVKLLHGLRAAALSARIQKPGAQRGGSGRFPRLPWSHVWSRGGSVKTVEPNQEAKKRAAPVFVVIRPLRHHRPLCFKQTRKCVCVCARVRAGRVARARMHARHFLAGRRVHVTWSCVYPAPSNKKIIYYVYQLIKQLQAKQKHIKLFSIDYI